MPLEIALTGGALLYYAARTRAPSGHLRLWVLAGLLALFQAIDWFGPKQPAYSLAIPATMLFAYALLALRSEEHTSELQSLMRISYAVFCLKKKTRRRTTSVSE